MSRGIFLALVLTVFFVVGGSTVVQANPCDELIYYNQVNDFYLEPIYPWNMCYYPTGQGTVRVAAQVTSGEHSPPYISVNIFWALSPSDDPEDWTFITSFNATGGGWKYSNPLYLNQGVYLISIYNGSYWVGGDIWIAPY